jgi:hypothetical protein
MRLYRSRRRFPVKTCATLLLFAVVMGAFLFGIGNVSSGAERESRKAAEQAVRRAIVSCYAIEGSYPESIAYLEEHYGVVLDHSKYEVNYQIVGGNVMPYFELLDVGGGQE